MANTYTQIHLQLIFGVKYREALIDPNWEAELHKYISEIIMKYKFNWQGGYGAFSYSKSDFDERYIFKQPISR